LNKTTAYLRLMRPANIVTSVADVIAGICISGFLAEKHSSAFFLVPVLLLCISTIGLYGGGVVFNDVFDAALDRVERPERPIPSGVISIKEATLLGGLLLSAGIIAAFLCNGVSGFIACMIAAAALVYNKWGKHHSIAGPLNMGLCRGLNLLLGISILPWAVQNWWALALVPIMYIASITMISRGEVHGGKKATLYAASMLYFLVISFILYFSHTQGKLVYAVIFIVPFAWMIFRPLLQAIRQPVGKNIGMAVKAGVLALILMDAAWAAAFGSLLAAMAILVLLPVSIRLGKAFAVT
jgi:4-hydroxybenzoate polyprenyltransferase